MLYLAFRHSHARQLDPQETVHQAQSSLRGRGPEERVYIKLVPQTTRQHSVPFGICKIPKDEFLDPFPSTLKQTNQTSSLKVQLFVGGIV